jgi:hypothetical protein
VSSVVPYWLGYEPQVSYLRLINRRYLSRKTGVGSPTQAVGVSHTVILFLDMSRKTDVGSAAHVVGAGHVRAPFRRRWSKGINRTATIRKTSFGSPKANCINGQNIVRDGGIGVFMKKRKIKVSLPKLTRYSVNDGYI